MGLEVGWAEVIRQTVSFLLVCVCVCVCGAESGAEGGQSSLEQFQAFIWSDFHILIFA